MSHPLLHDCLQALSRAPTNEAKRRVFQTYRRDLLRHPEIGAELAAMVASARKEDEVAVQLDVLELLIGEARMDQENGGAYGPAFLSALEQTIEDGSGKGAITDTASFLLGRFYVRGGLAVPQRLRRSPTEAQRARRCRDIPNVGCADNPVGSRNYARSSFCRRPSATATS